MSDSLLAQLPPSMTTVQTRHLMAVRFVVEGPVTVGPTPGGERRVGVITDGRFEGERLRGRVLSGGSDWQYVRTDGAWTLNVRVLLETDDKALIGLQYQGVRHGPPEVIAKIARGETVEPSSYYFRTNPLFETSSERYGWLNRIVGIGLGHRFPDGPLYNIFEVL